ncbi:MAG TPA: putative beta-lysine N-acetyltransferase [bacterium]|nr:putative beta-lysine N-acetyltransferase [bacterium]
MSDHPATEAKNLIPVVPVVEPAAPGALEATDEWSGLEPTEKDMGLVHFTLDKGVKTTVVGTVYGLDFEIEDAGYRVNVFFDYYNKRLKVLDYDATDYSAMIRRLAWLAEANRFDKIFVKAGREDFQRFLSHGYMMEGVLRYYFRGEDAYVLSRFSSLQRVRSESLIEEAQLIETLIYDSERGGMRKLDPDIEIVSAGEEHIPQLAFIYRGVFETYPSPLTNPDYIKSTMDRNVVYRLALRDGEAIAAASAEISRKHANAEMTDCATLPAAQGRGLMQHILSRLEDDLRERSVTTAYTLARAMSIGMNRVFFRLGYEFSGRLINNCDIFGRFEDMNIWVKKL